MINNVVLAHPFHFSYHFLSTKQAGTSRHKAEPISAYGKCLVFPLLFWIYSLQFITDSIWKVSRCCHSFVMSTFSLSSSLLSLCRVSLCSHDKMPSTNWCYMTLRDSKWHIFTVFPEKFLSWIVFGSWFTPLPKCFDQADSGQGHSSQCQGHSARVGVMELEWGRCQFFKGRMVAPTIFSKITFRESWRHGRREKKLESQNSANACNLIFFVVKCTF